MISYISGKILRKSVNYLVIESGGLGYKVAVTPESLEVKIGDSIELFTYLKVSDDGMSLYGVPTEAELDFFELLITVNGIGPKMAMQILSATKIETLKEAIGAGNAEMFTKMSGIGKKTAERIILELKGKLGADNLVGSVGNGDIYDALIALGFSSKEIRDVLPKINTSESNESQLKTALKLLQS